MNKVTGAGGDNTDGTASEVLGNFTIIII